MGPTPVWPLFDPSGPGARLSQWNPDTRRALQNIAGYRATAFRCCRGPEDCVIVKIKVEIAVIASRMGSPVPLRSGVAISAGGADRL